MENKFTIVGFGQTAAGEEFWTPFLDHTDAIRAELEPEEPRLPREKRLALMRSAFEMPEVSRYFYLLFAGGEKAAAGYAGIFLENANSPSYNDNKHTANLELSVLPRYRRHGLASALLRHVAVDLAAKEPAVRELYAPVSMDAGCGFCGKFGGTVSLEVGSNRLYLKDADWARVERWADEGARRNPDTAIVETPVIPEADIKEFSEVYTETLNQAPQGDTSQRLVRTPEQIRQYEEKCLKDGVGIFNVYAKEKDGSISGLTEIGYLKEAGHKVTQYLTGVREACRGRGLGKLLKARMLLHIRREYPAARYVATSNADSNAPMMAINQKLGFKKHRSLKVYKLKLPLPGGEGRK